MKRAFTQKIGSVPSCAADNEGVSPYSLEHDNRSSGSELVRQVRASATTIGLAIAMAASGMLLTQKHHKVMAAEEFGVADTSEALPSLSDPRAEKAVSGSSKVSAPAVQSSRAGKSVELETAEVSVPTNAVKEPTPIVARAEQSSNTRRSVELETAEAALPTNAVKEPTPIVARAEQSSNTQKSVELETAEAALPTSAVKEPTPIAARAAKSLTDAASLPDDREPKVALNSTESKTEQSATAKSDEETVGLIPQSQTSRELLTDTTKVIDRAKSGDTLATIGETYDTSVAQLTKLNSPDSETPSQSKRRSDASDTVKAAEGGLHSDIEELKNDAASSTSSVQEANNNELQAEIADISQGTQVRTLVAQTVPISVPDPDTVATATPAPQSDEASRPADSEVASAEGIEIAVPKPENRNNSAARLGIQRSTAQPRRIPIQNQPNEPVPIRQADSLQPQAEAIEIPVPKPATNFIPNRSNPERLATAPLGADEYNSDVPSSSSQDGSRDRFINPSGNVAYGWPVSGRITSGFGMRWGRLHAGIDFGVPTGTPVYASAPGVVLRSGWVGGYGNLVEIKHADGSVTRYGHNSQLMLQAGQEVHQGEVIALSGNTGRSTGPHVHFEIRPDGKQAVNPMSLLPRRA